MPSLSISSLISSLEETTRALNLLISGREGISERLGALQCLPVNLKILSCLILSSFQRSTEAIGLFGSSKFAYDGALERLGVLRSLPVNLKT